MNSVSKFLQLSSGSQGGKCLSVWNVLHPLSNRDLAQTPPAET